MRGINALLEEGRKKVGINWILAQLQKKNPPRQPGYAGLGFSS